MSEFNLSKGELENCEIQSSMTVYDSQTERSETEARVYRVIGYRDKGL